MFSIRVVKLRQRICHATLNSEGVDWLEGTIYLYTLVEPIDQSHNPVCP